MVAVLPALVCPRPDPEGRAAGQLPAAVPAGGGGGLPGPQAEDSGRAAEVSGGPAAGPLPPAAIGTGVLAGKLLASQQRARDLLLSLRRGRHHADAAQADQRPAVAVPARQPRAV